MAVMAGIVLILFFGGRHLLLNIADMTEGLLSLRYGNAPLHVLRVASLQAMQFIAPFLLSAVILTLLTGVMAGGVVIKPFTIEFERLNPVNGIKRLFSLRGLMEFLKSLLKFMVGGWLVYYIIKKDLRVLPFLPAMEMDSAIKVSWQLIISALMTALLYFMVVAFISYLLERWQYERSLRMTREEVKEEHKEVEGDPRVKSRIRTLQMEAARRRMMQEVPKATVVITNPTHIAVAIKYEEKMIAPKITAKGAGIVAEKIKEIAETHGVPVIEDRPLARALFRHDLDTFIPEELYVAVAKILAYIYKLRGKL